jgi:hypothetical protein
MGDHFEVSCPDCYRMVRVRWDSGEEGWVFRDHPDDGVACRQSGQLLRSYAQRRRVGYSSGGERSHRG